jgi:hypothetical protein
MITTMFEINIYLRRHWGELEKALPGEKYFSIDDKLSSKELFDMSPSRRYNYGKVIIVNNGKVFLEEECEIDFFISTIQFEKEKLFSGKSIKIDNSYFQLTFHYHDKLTIEHEGKKITVRKQDFIDAFRASAQKYYLLLAKLHTNKADYKDMESLLTQDWS